MTPLVVDPSGYLKPHHSVGHCQNSPVGNRHPNNPKRHPPHRSHPSLTSTASQTPVTPTTSKNAP